MENDFQKDQIDDVFSDLETSTNMEGGKDEVSTPHYESETIFDESGQEKYENSNKSNLGFFAILTIILILGVLMVFIILK